jgi:outer membrane protein TolC
MRLALVCLVAALPLAAQEPLRLEEVLESVRRHYPPLLAALQDRVLATADVLAASSRFDLSLKSGYEGDYLGKYRNDIYKAGIEQATQFQGMTYFAGYQLGRGSFASYDGKLQTDTGGEYKAGVKLPLLRDRSIDPRRADLQKALIGRRIADLGVDQQRLVILQMATRRYYQWLATGGRYRAARAVLQVAEQRDGQLREAARLGQIPAIDVTDNQRAILTRRAQLIEAERALQQSAIELSLFYRGPSGEPVLPGPERLPQGFPALHDIDEQRLKDDIELALRRRPEIRRFREQRNQVEIDRKLAQNQLLPNVDVSLSFTSQLGERRVGRGPNDLVAALVFDLPAQRRAAKSRDLAALARIEQFDQRERFARDQVEAEVRDAYSALKAAYERARVLREEVEVARQLEAAERVRFELGEGNLFLVNLREQATFETELREVAAIEEYFRALALYEFAIAEALSGPARP